jgi:hypothetical protein
VSLGSAHIEQRTNWNCTARGLVSLTRSAPTPPSAFYDFFFFRDSVVFVAEEELLLTHRGLSVDAAVLPFLVTLALLTVALDFFFCGFFWGALSPSSALGREVVGDANSRSSASLSRDLAEPVPTLIIELLD